MNTLRARRIATAFSTIQSFAVETTKAGVLVHFLNNHAYFESEDKFWLFAFKLAQVNHEESRVAEIETEFAA